MPTLRRFGACFAVSAAVATALAAGGCEATGASGTATGDHVTVLASFYPLQYLAQEIGGDHVTVENLTPPAAEPHDLELSPAHVRSLGKADLVVYLSGFQPAVDEAIDQRKPAHVVDAADAAKLEQHPNGSSATITTTDGTSVDPHFWLDPTRLAAVGKDVANALTAVDPSHKADYEARAKDLDTRLTELDTTMASDLKPCESALLVTTHTAFGYLAERYDLDQVGIIGIDPESEPSPARLREIATITAGGKVSTLYTETLLSSKVTTTLASDLGLKTARLDPLEAQTDQANDYIAVMGMNLKALTDGLVCT